MGQLDGKVVWITGGSRGIGAGIARGCAEAGARVVISARKQGPLDEAAAAMNVDFPGQVFAKTCHVGHPEAIAQAVTWIEDTVGPIDVLVNNAAAAPYFGPLIQTPQAAWDKTFQINVWGAFQTTQHVVERMRSAKRSGSIINVASIQGQQAAPLQGVYGMTKAALISMSKTLAVELGRAQIRVNAIAPGLVETRFASILIENPELLAEYTKRAALGRHGQPSELAGIVVYLASEASSYVTGQVFTIDGGYSIT